MPGMSATPAAPPTPKDLTARRPRPAEPGARSLQSRRRFWRSSADWDTAAVLIDTSSHMPAIGGRPVASKVGVLWGMILAALLPKPLYQQFCGQGRGRTADLPIFRLRQNRSEAFLKSLSAGPGCIGNNRNAVERT